jgi:hypothetical protein
MDNTQNAGWGMIKYFPAAGGAGQARRRTLKIGYFTGF